jgi:hypothetical protein
MFIFDHCCEIPDVSSQAFSTCPRCVYVGLKRFDFKTMIVALMMEVVGTSETPVYIYETTRHHIPEGCYFHTRRDNLRSHIFHVLGIHVEEYTAARS